MTDKPDLTGTKWLKEECLTCPRLEDGQRGMEDRFCHWRECVLARLELQLAQCREALERAGYIMDFHRGRCPLHPCGSESHMFEYDRVTKALETLLANPDPSGIVARLRAGERAVEMAEARMRVMKRDCDNGRVPCAACRTCTTHDERTRAWLEAKADYDKAVNLSE